MSQPDEATRVMSRMMAAFALLEDVLSQARKLDATEQIFVTAALVARTGDLVKVLDGWRANLKRTGADA